jgi:diguanylate cyclase (GGDEF)-like protein
MWHVAILMHLVAAATVLAVLPVPDPDPTDHEELLAMAGVFTLIAIALTALGPGRSPLSLVPLSGIVLVSALVGLTSPVGATPFFYLWPTLYAAYFLTRRRLLVALAVLYATYASALWLGVVPGMRMMLFVGGVMSCSVAALLVNALKLRLDRTVDRLHETAATDPLTGILNRRAFETAFDGALSRAARSGEELTLLVIDIDHFKLVNDGFGHAAGDRALCRVARVLRQETRASDVVARLGGEEFGVLMADSGAAAAALYVERVAAALAVAVAGDVPLSVSAGAASAALGRGTREALMLAADTALYRAKDAGRSRVAVADGDVSVVGTTEPGAALSAPVP